MKSYSPDGLNFHRRAAQRTLRRERILDALAGAVAWLLAIVFFGGLLALTVGV